MSENIQPRAVVTAIIERKINGILHIYMQTRWKPATDPVNSGTLELPAGGINHNENVYDAIIREVKEESSLVITDFIDNYSSDVQMALPGNSSIAFKPFICQQSIQTTGGQSWVGYVFRCHADGEAEVNPSEVINPRWITISQLKVILSTAPEQIFSLQLASLRYYLDVLDQESRQTF